MDRFEDVKLRVKEANDLVALIEGSLPLRKAGRNLIALCPFHQEKTPSFTVYPDSQHYKCYGCGKAGDVFTFVMEREGVSFREAFEVLAQRVGISTERVFGASDRAAKAASGHEVLAAVRRFFQEALQLPSGRVALDYLRRRGLEDGIEPFGLGVHPTEPGALLRFARAQRLPLEVLEGAGLVRDGRESFRGRVMFPIEDVRGRVVGFGGRALDDAPAKYLNSPESPLFRKRSVLYGLRRVKEAGERRIVVVEGYTDVIACHLAGFRGAVATLGTALTPEHGRALTRFATAGVVLLFDGDRAGRAAAEKAYGELVRTELPLRTAMLPEGMDPADLLAPRPELDEAERAARRASFQAVLDGAEDALDMWFRLKRARMNLTLESNVAAAIEECGRVLDGLDDPARRLVLLDRMSRHLGLDAAVLRRSLGRRRGSARAQPEPGAGAAAAAGKDTVDPLRQVDAEMLACVLAKPSLAASAQREAGGAAGLTALLAAAVEAVAEGVSGRDALLHRLFAGCAEQPELGALLARAADLSLRIREPDEALALVGRQLRAFIAKREARQLRFELTQARADGDQALALELTRRYMAQLREHTFT